MGIVLLAGVLMLLVGTVVTEVWVLAVRLGGLDDAAERMLEP